MAISKHNRALAFVFVFVILVLGIILYQSRNVLLSESVKQKIISELPQLIPQDQLGTNVNNFPFLEILKSMGVCLQLQTVVPNGLSPNFESLLLVLQPALGPQTNKDKSLTWILRGRDGLQKKLYLNIVADENGNLFRQIEYYSVDTRGTEVRLELDQVKSHNPSDEYINSFLKDVDVLKKTKASTAEFTSGAVMNYEEQGSELVNFEIVSNGNTYHCQSLRSTDSCQCLH